MQDVLVDRDYFVKSVSKRLHQVACELARENKSSLPFHNALQRKVVDLGAEFGFRGVREYPVHGSTDEAEGLADVAWMAQNRLACAFEIDSTPNANSLRKLLTLNAPLRFWIYYGHQHYLSMVRHVDRTSKIEVIRLQNVYF
jgi:hypothetical protein